MCSRIILRKSLARRPEAAQVWQEKCLKVSPPPVRTARCVKWLRQATEGVATR